MKQRIGSIYGKPVVEGSPNEVKKNEIHYIENNGSITLSKRNSNNELESISGGSSSGNTKMLYFRWTEEQLDNDPELYTIVQVFTSSDPSPLPFVYAECLILLEGLVVNVPHSFITNNITSTSGALNMTILGFRYSDVGIVTKDNSIIYYKDFLNKLSDEINEVSDIPIYLVDTLYKYKVTEEEYTDGVVTLLTI